METKTIKQALRDFFSFRWLRERLSSLPGRGQKASACAPRHDYYRSSYSRERSFWERNKDDLKLSLVIVIALLMATCAGVDFVWKGKVGQTQGKIVELRRFYDHDNSEYDYYVSVSWSGGVSQESVTRGTWNSLREGQKCTVHYVTGGVTGLTWAYDINY